jgi:hypothetical protein
MKMPRRAGVTYSRSAAVLAIAACLVALTALAGCGPPPPAGTAEETQRGLLAEWLSKDDPEPAGSVFGGPAPKAAPDGTVMEYEEVADGPLVGDWSYPGMNYTPTNKQWGKGKLWPDTEPHTVTFVKQGEVYSLKGDSFDTVTFDGTNVTIEGTSGGGIHSKYSGVLKGDTITGTRHHDVEKLVYDGPWTATRVK